MTAREIDSAASRLQELRALTAGDLGLAALAFALALAASVMHPPLALPLLAGAFAMTFLGLRAFLRRSFLVEELAREPEAYELVDVRRFCARAATPARRRLLAERLRTATADPAAASFRLELEEIVSAVEAGRPVEPHAAAELDRCLDEFLLGLHLRSLPEGELRGRLQHAAARLSESGR